MVKILYLNLGGCNGCDIELLAGVFRLEERGISLERPDHNIEHDEYDITIVTGPGTLGNFCRILNSIKRFGRINFGDVIILGSCACGGGIWYDSYMVTGGWDYIIEELKARGIDVKYRSQSVTRVRVSKKEDVEKAIVQVLHR